MPPLATVCGTDLPRVELSGNGVEACMAGRLDVPNDRQDVGREFHACALRATRMRSTAPAVVAFRTLLAAAKPEALIWLSTDPKARECPSYGWSEETRLLLLVSYNRRII
jgi:hypothetical protein